MARCKHHYLQVEEFNALGQVVSCTECNRTFQLSENAGSIDYVPFSHNIPGRGERTIVFLIHHSKVRQSYNERPY